MLNKILGSLLIILPVLLVVMIYSEGGVLAIGMYILYLIATVITTLSPWYGYKMLRSSK